MRKRPYSLLPRPYIMFLSLFLPLLFLWQIQQALPTAANQPSQLQSDHACMRFSLDQGRQAKTGARINGRYEMREANTERTLATWEAGSQETTSGWIGGIPISFKSGVWVELFFYAAGQTTPTKLEIINHAPDTAYGWIAAGQCHAIELQFPPNWFANAQGGGGASPTTVTDQPQEDEAQVRPFETISFSGTGQSIGASPSEDVALGDVDGDGDLDAFVANAGANKVWLNDGQGFFQDSGQNLGEADSRSVVLGDFDGDGDIDAFTANIGSDVVWLNENGLFTPSDQIFPYTISYEAALADLDSDGYLDIVVANVGENEVWLNNGISSAEEVAFTLKTQTDAEWGAKTSGGVALAHLDDDIYIDVVIVPDGVWLNNEGTGEFVYDAEFSNAFIHDSELETALAHDSAFAAHYEDKIQKNYSAHLEDKWAKVVLGDLDNDENGRVDAIIALIDLFIYENNSADNGLLSAVRIEPRKGVDTFFNLALGDLDKDGDLDAFAVHTGPNRSVILRNDGNFDFSVADRFAANYGQSVALGDLNGDGMLDAFLANGNESANSANFVLLNTSLMLRQSNQSLNTVEQEDLLLADLDNDGTIELLAADTNGRILEISGEQIGLVGNRPEASSPLAIDSLIELLTNKANKVKEEKKKIAIKILQFASADLNNDSYADLVAFYKRGGVTVFFNSGQSGTNSWREERLDLGIPADEGSIAFGYFDQDSYLDIFIGNSCNRPHCSKANLVYLNQSGAFIQSPQEVGSGSSHDVVLGDLDGDNDVDAFVGNYWNQANKVFLNDGEGTFIDSGLELGGFSTLDVDLADLDGDGDLDALETRYNMGVAVWWNDGDAHFTEDILWWGPDDDIYVETADLNGDGLHDILVTTNKNFVLLLNGGQGQFTSQNLSNGRAVWPTSAIEDVDNDGDPDILLAFKSGLELYINDRQGINSAIDNSSYITVRQPFLPVSEPGALISDTIIPISYTLFTAQDERVGQVVAYYSLNRGGQWFEAKTANITDTINLAHGEHVFHWDTFDSGFFGVSNDVVLRLVAQTQPERAEEMGTFSYPNEVAGSFLAASHATTTPLFRVQGTQIQVFQDDPDDPAMAVPNAAVYHLPNGALTAQLLGSAASQQPFLTDQNGFLSGRPVLQEHDQLMALVPISRTYRIPPQLLLDGSPSYAEVASLNQPPTSTFTAELWFFPTGNGGRLLSLGKDFSLSFTTLPEASTVTMTVKNNTTAAHLATFKDGNPHHLAFSWDGTATTANSILYLDGTAVFTTTLAPDEILTEGPFTIGKDYSGSIDEIRLWRTVRSQAQISEALFTGGGAFVTSDRTLLTTQPNTISDLVGYWPVGDEDSQALADLSGNQNQARLINQATVGFKPLYTLFHTSGTIEDSVVNFTPVTSPGVQTLTVSSQNPLILFNLDVSLEWDGRSDTLFLQQLEDSFRRASALLYDVTNGQIALGQINLYHNKAYWGVADIIVFADNSLRPSAAIGGVINAPVSETVYDPETEAYDKSVPEAYLPGQIRMGTSWDPYGENIADLGEDWTRALAHELAHYFLFLPDNYLGIENSIFQRVVCPGSFMTTTSDPSFSEFLTEKEWLREEENAPDCRNTLAELTTGRPDWATILKFYPMLFEPENPPIEGPPDLPLNVTYLVPWAYFDESLPLPERNFDIRNVAQERLRLPTAQAFLIKTQGTTIPDPNKPDSLDYLQDDTMIALGSPVGGGDRLHVRGAEPNDRLCVLDSQENQIYSGCIGTISNNTVSVTAAPLHPDFPTWQPSIVASAASPYSVTITVTQNLLLDEKLYVQLYPMHYGSVVDNAPAAVMDRDGTTHTQQLTVALPAYEYAVRVWAKDDGRCQTDPNQRQTYSCIREAVTILRLNPDNWELLPPNDDADSTAGQNLLLYAPFKAGPDRTAIGGPDRTAIGGPDRTAIGGPDRTAIGGPDRTAIGGPDRTAIGGAIFLGNPDRTAIGGPDRTAIGGAENILLGSANATAVGGAVFLGNPDRTAIGGGDDASTSTAPRSLNAPILSADAQVVIYSQEGFFADNGVESLQALAVIPEQSEHPWLIPVGQAYRVVLSEQNMPRFISFTYLQREVPEGYEHTLKIFFLPEAGKSWELVNETVGLVENLIVGKLEPENGVYAIMATLDDMPMLNAGWNLLAYPLPDIRCVSTNCDPEGKLANATLTEEQSSQLALYQAQCSDNGLASLGNRVSGLLPSDGTSEIPETVAENLNTPIAVETLTPGTVYWIYLTDGPDIGPQFAPPRRLPDGTLPNCTALHDFIEALPATPQ